MPAEFQLKSDFSPTGDQPAAIEQLVSGIEAGDKHQVLLGVTGSGKTFTVANLVARINRPTLVLSHNKTLAAQLFGEFKQFFPNNAVEFFVSYYDYYQPEAYLPTTDTYIEKDLAINDEIEKHRLSTTSSLLSGRRDVLVVASVSCIYGLGNPIDFKKNTVTVQVGQVISRNTLLHQFVTSLYSRAGSQFERGNFRVNGDVVDIWPAYGDIGIRIYFFGDEVEEIAQIDPVSGVTIAPLTESIIFPATNFVTNKDTLLATIWQIQEDMMAQTEYFRSVGKHLEAKRLEERVTHDLEMMRELGYCSGIENYSRYFDGRETGNRPFCLLDYFPEDYLMVIDESHVSVPQVGAMYGGDRSRKVNLVEYGFRLPSAMDNRPLRMEEFEALQNQVVYVSATPADAELRKAGGVVVEQLIRPTGLLDPVIEVRPSSTQVDDLMEQIALSIEKGERVLVTTLTKRMAEELAKYLARLNVNCRYIHSDVSTIERVEILRDLRLGNFDVLIGINLLREGLDLPEVGLVAILDADKEGFLRSERSLVQTIGRAARHVNGRAILYADKITNSMRLTIDDNHRKRIIQQRYNDEHGIVPTQIVRTRESILNQTSVAGARDKTKQYDRQRDEYAIAAEESLGYMTRDDLQKLLATTRSQMETAAKDLDFVEAARLRDRMKEVQAKLG